MERILNEENDWDHVVEGYAVEGPVVCESRDEGKVDIRKCSCYVAVKLLEHGMKLVKRVLENRLHKIVSVDEMQFGFMPD